MNYWLEGENPGSYFDKDEWRYRPCIRNNDGAVIWKTELVTYWHDIAATQHAKRHAHRRWMAENPELAWSLND